MISVCFQGKPFNITVIQVYVPISNAEEAEVEQFYEDLQDLLELTPKKDVLFIIGAWNTKIGSQETPGVTGKFGLGIWNEAGQRRIEFCQENTLVITNTLFQQHKRRLYTWTSPDGQHRNQTYYILCSQRWGNYAAAAAKVLQSCLTLCDRIDGSPPGLLSTGFSRQEYWSRVPLPSPGEALYSQQKQDQELTLAQIMNSLLPNSDLN